MIVDTSALSVWAAGNASVEAILKSAERLTVPSIVLGEHYFSIRQSRYGDRAEGAESSTSDHGAFDAKSCSAALLGVLTGNYRIAGMLPKLRRTTQQHVMRLDGGIPNVADEIADRLQTRASGLRPDFGCALPYGKMIQGIEF